MHRLKWLCFLMLAAILVAGCSQNVGKALAPSDDFGAYYSKVNSGETFEKFSRTGPYADIIVDLGKDNGRFVFWRGSSYLPYWETANGKWFVDEIIPRSGDGSGIMPDKVNTYSHVEIIENTPEKVLVHWRYLPQFRGTNPHSGVDARNFVDEYYTINPAGNVTRIIKQGTKKIDDWNDPLNQYTQSFSLMSAGIGDKKLSKPQSSGPAAPVSGSAIKTGVVAKPVAWWKLDEAAGDYTAESVSNERSEIAGHKSLWRKGVSGTALQFDGYNSEIDFPSQKAPKISSAITLEGWVAIGAYPWSWVPIVQQCDDVPEEIQAYRGKKAVLTGEEDVDEEGEFHVELKKENDTGYFLGINGYGNPGLKIKVGGEWQELVSKVHLERKHWYQIAGTYDRQTGKMAVYVDGKLAGEMNVPQTDIALSTKDVRIGKGKNRRPINPVRMNTFVDSYSLDGLLDEIKIYDVALSPDQIMQSYENFKPADEIVNNPEMDKRVLPSGTSTGKFGAYYSHLEFYDVWDNMWRFGDYPDVVVDFDELPTKFIFWRGTGYIPMMVNEKGQWYSNEFNETWNKSGGKGCQEPMSDKEAYSDHARIIENTPARVVVQWRFPLKDVLHVVANYDQNTGWGDWSDWYYYIYPDGIAVKKMHLWTNGERNHEWQESMAIFGPDQHPEQIIEKINTVTMANLDGKYVNYNWISGPPPDVDAPQDKCIQYINYTGEYDPVTIGKFLDSNVYGGELTPYAVFPTWNHWPVSQMPSDGRYASFPDRSAHSSLTHVEMPDYAAVTDGDTPYEEKILMEAMLKDKPIDLMPLARSWMTAPALENSVGCTSRGYDESQRAYLLAANARNISFDIAASKKRPVYNLCFVVKNWNSKSPANLNINGEPRQSGSSLRQGIIRDTDGSRTLIVWIQKQSVSPVKIEINQI